MKISRLYNVSSATKYVSPMKFKLYHEANSNFYKIKILNFLNLIKTHPLLSV